MSPSTDGMNLFLYWDLLLLHLLQFFLLAEDRKSATYLSWIPSMSFTNPVDLEDENEDALAWFLKLIWN